MAAQPEFEEILDRCLARLRAGESVADCLADYPDLAADLHPLLLMATEIRTLPRPQARPQAVRQGKERMLRALQTKKSPWMPVSFLLLLRYTRQMIGMLTGKEPWDMKLAIRFSAVALVLFFILGTPITIAASSQSLPDEPLYPVKRAWEGVRYALTADSQARQQLDEEYQERRLEEVATLVDRGREGTFELSGKIEAMDGGEWTIAGMRVLLTEKTTVEGNAIVGASVRARARVQRDGQIALLHVRVVPTDPRPDPTISPLPTPHATRTPCPEPTRPPHPTPGPWPTPTPLPEGTATPDPEPTRPPHPTPGPWPTPTRYPEPTRPPHPTPGPWPTPNPTPTPGPEPTHPPHPTPGPWPTPPAVTPTPYPEPTRPPRPTPGPWPTPTAYPEPTRPPHPTPGPWPTPTAYPEPTRPPHPTPGPWPTPPAVTPTPYPEPTRPPRPTPGPWPTPNPTPTRYPEPTRPPHPTPGPWPTPNPTPTRYPEPTRPPHPTPEPWPTPTQPPIVEPTPTPNPIIR